jgi:hypothetical protein
MKIHVQAITDKMKDREVIKWGDYWFKRHIRNAFGYLGHKTVLKSNKASASLLLHGTFKTSKAPIKSVWIYGNMSRIDANVLKNYFQLVYTLSHKGTSILQTQGVQCSTLLPATAVMYDVSTNKAPKEVIYMGSIKKYDDSCPRLSYLKHLSDAKVCSIDIVGEGWSKYISGRMNYISSYWRHKYYPDLFSKYKLAVYVHAPDMLSWDFVALRILDMIATGSCLVISDYNEGLIPMFGDIIPMFKTKDELASQVDYFLSHESERQERWYAARQIISQQHLLKYRVQKMVTDYENLLS